MERGAYHSRGSVSVWADDGDVFASWDGKDGAIVFQQHKSLLCCEQVECLQNTMRKKNKQN